MASPRAWSGWIGFAGLMLMIIGAIDFFEGLIAVITPTRDEHAPVGELLAQREELRMHQTPREVGEVEDHVPEQHEAAREHQARLRLHLAGRELDVGDRPGRLVRLVHAQRRAHVDDGEHEEADAGDPK